MNFQVAHDREGDGPRIAEVRALPGAPAHGSSLADALSAGQAHALRIIADRMEQGRPPPGP